MPGSTFVFFDVDTINNCVIYTGLSATGTDTACIVTCYESGVCDTTILVVTVVPDTQLDSLPPIAVNDTASLTNISTVTINVLQNDTLNGTLTEIKIITPPSHGTASILGNYYVFYEPSFDYCNSEVPDSLQYTICNSVGCDTAWVYILKPCTDIVIYDGFSPNEDGMNDAFTIEGVQYFPNNELQVYNRWGNRVLFTKQYKNDWRGTWDGRPLPDGTYFYLFDDGEGRRFSGPLTIMR